MRFVRARDVQQRSAPSGAETGGNAGNTRKALAFTVLLGAGTAGAACTPNVTITNIPYDPTMPDGGSCLVLKECKTVNFELRDSSSSAGTSSKKVFGATLSLTEVVDKDGTKAVNVSMEACGETVKNDNPIKSTGDVTLTVGGQSFKVVVSSISYDTSGVLVSGTVTPVCTPDAGVDSGKKDSSVG